MVFGDFSIYDDLNLFLKAVFLETLSLLPGN